MPCSHPAAWLLPRPAEAGAIREIECRACGEVVDCPHPISTRIGGPNAIDRNQPARCALCRRSL